MPDSPITEEERRQKIVAVAGDVKKLLEAQKIKASFSTYFYLETKNQGLEAYANLPLRETLERVLETPQTDEYRKCEVCAIGALFLGRVLQEDKADEHTIRLAQGRNVAYGNYPLHYSEGLFNVFTRGELSMIEGLFMSNESYYADYVNGLDPEEAEEEGAWLTPLEACISNEDYRALTSSEKLALILDVLVEQEGRFEPWKHHFFTQAAG